MSYTKKYSETVSKRVRVEYDVPRPYKNSDDSYTVGATTINIVNYARLTVYPGDNGSKTVTVEIPVDVNIHVDTEPFDQSVNDCNSTVHSLTGAVTATESAQIASISANAQKVAGTVVNGFFGYIRSEFSQQMVELSKKIEALLLHLRELSKSCTNKKKQMETDYNRLTGRYMDIFDDLNHELENRIFELNKPAFVFKTNSDNHLNRSIQSDMVSSVAVSGLESGELHTKINASIVKKRVLDTIHQTNRFLWKQKKTDTTINQSRINENMSAFHYAPVCFIETQNEKNHLDKHIYQPVFLSGLKTNELIEKFQNQHWIAASNEYRKTIQHYFNTEVNHAYGSGNAHENRIKEMMLRYFKSNPIQSVNN